MGEYKCVAVKNKSLTAEEFEALKRQLAKLDSFIPFEDSVSSWGKSTIKKEFNIDTGCMMTQYASFIQKIKFYAKDYLHGIQIC